VKNGKLYPLFIDRNKEIIMGKWLLAESHPTEGFAVRIGWHCTLEPIAPHLKMNLANGEKRVWVECEVEGWKLYHRPESQGGTWLLTNKIKIIRVM
jgi:hypothetical protein